MLENQVWPQSHSAAKAATKKGTIHEITRKVTKVFVSVRVGSWIVASVKSLLKKQGVANFIKIAGGILHSSQLDFPLRNMAE